MDSIDKSLAMTQTAIKNKAPLTELLSTDLDFHDESSTDWSHNVHAFPAKFPPQLPRKFIEGLTAPGDLVLDPMVGSGTTLLEAYLRGRRGVGFDIDPLALLIAATKTRPLSAERAISSGRAILESARGLAAKQPAYLRAWREEHFSRETLRFIDYWFAPCTQAELFALTYEIGHIPDVATRSFLQLILSSIIVTKSGGVSLAFDLAHTRPHRAKVAYDPDGNLLFGEELLASDSPRIRFLTKRLRSVFDIFEKKLSITAKEMPSPDPQLIPSVVQRADARRLPLEANTVDLVVTSPPYASNAIDYMRAHKFSLVWLGYDLAELSDARGEYIGGEATSQFAFTQLPDFTTNKIAEVAERDQKKAAALRRYYCEMQTVLKELYRVLKPGAAAIVVVGSSVLRGVNTETELCLEEIGEEVGFPPAPIGVREIDRDRRMMPAGRDRRKHEGIEARMHREYVLGFEKPTPSSPEASR